MTSQVTGPRKVKVSGFLPRNGAWLEVGRLSGGFPDEGLLNMSVKKGSHLQTCQSDNPQIVGIIAYVPLRT